MTIGPDEALKIVLVVGVADGVVVTPDGTIETPDGGAAELDVAVEAIDGADEMLDGREAATVAVGLNAVVAVVRGG